MRPAISTAKGINQPLEGFFVPGDPSYGPRLVQRGMVKRVLILCPLSTVQSVWGNELFQTLWGEGVRYQVLYAPREKLSLIHI